MKQIDFPTSHNVEQMAAEIVCLKATLALVLKALGQADGGKVIMKMEKLTEAHENCAEAEVFKQTLGQIRQAYRNS